MTPGFDEIISRSDGNSIFESAIKHKNLIILFFQQQCDVVIVTTCKNSQNFRHKRITLKQQNIQIVSNILELLIGNSFIFSEFLI